VVYFMNTVSFAATDFRRRQGASHEHNDPFASQEQFYGTSKTR